MPLSPVHYTIATMGNQTSRVAESERSAASDSTDEESNSTRLPSLHGNLMRSQHKRDPMKYYEVIEFLGEGSMGSVAKVRKRNTAVGGSARAEFVNEKGCCFQLFPFLHITNKPKFEDVSKHGDGTATPLSSSMSSSNHRRITPKNKKVLLHKPSSLISYRGSKTVIYALKSLHLDRCTSVTLKEELKNEVDILRTLDHPHILKAIETFNYKDQLFLVLELCGGGDLYSRDPYTEEQACGIIQGLMSAIAYLHSRNIVHRDLKFENIMFVNKSPTAEVKLIDFGLSQKYAADTHLHDAVGTVYSMAPELLGRDYDSKVDVWSLGVITFMLLSSSMPFYGKDRVQVIKRIIRGKYQFSSRRWRYISTAAKGFCERLLMVDPEERPTAEQALQYTWVSQDFEDYGAEPDIDAMDNIQAAIQCFAGYRKLKKLALMVVAYKSTSEEIGFLRKMFNRFDKMKDGEISLQEFKEAFSEHYDYTDEELAKLFEGIDIDGTGSVHYSEFLASTIEAHGSIDEERLAEAFDRIDCDDTGYITTNNLKEFLGEDIPEKYLVDIINEADIRQDKKIAYDEFLALWNDDSDQILKSAKIQAEARRATRANSPTISSVPSTEGSTEGLTDSERGRLSDSARNITASLCFEHLKHVEPVESDDPVQSDWV